MIMADSRLLRVPFYTVSSSYHVVGVKNRSTAEMQSSVYILQGNLKVIAILSSFLYR